MTVPLILLALLSVAGGFLGVPESLGGGNAIEHWLEPVFAPALAKIGHAPHAVEAVEYILMALSVGAALAMIFVARSWYLHRQDIPQRLRTAIPALYTLLLNKYFVDEVYDATVVSPVMRGSDRILWKGVDTTLIDGAVNGSARVVDFISRALRVVQTGFTGSYVLVFITGVFLLVTWLLFR
jgi:NADH-quinone oxidoreductase subunit L